MHICFPQISDTDFADLLTTRGPRILRRSYEPTDGHRHWPRKVRKIERSPRWANRRVQRRAAKQSRETEKCTRAFVLIPN